MKPHILRYLAKKIWVAENPGVFARIADDLGTARQYVAQVFWGDRNNDQIRAALEGVDAPYIGKTDEEASSKATKRS